MGLQHDCARVLHEALLVPILLYSSGTMIWRENERSVTTTVQMENFRGLLGLMIMDKYRIHRLESCAKWRKRWMKFLMKVFFVGLP